jgi:Cdc6-like AAA superfamily ATPase
MNRDERDEVIHKLGVIFKPSTPITSLDIFSGRQSELSALVSAINQNGRHAILYGERAVGKTSLSNVIRFHLRCPGAVILTPLCNCTADDSFKAIWARVFVGIAREAEKRKFTLPRSVGRYMKLAAEGFDDFITLEIVQRVLEDVGSGSVLVVTIDEFDALRDLATRRAVADTIKCLSDRNVPATVVLVGVSDDVEGLIADHQSVERCLAQVPMPRMERNEIEHVVRFCLGGAVMTIEPLALHEISRISQGLPHYAHLLGLHSGIAAVEHSSMQVTQSHVDTAVPAAIKNTQASIQKAYAKATTSSRKNAIYREVLAGCAMVTKDDFGYFSPGDLRTPLGVILNKEARIEVFVKHLHSFCEDEFGPILKKATVRGRPRFRFFNSLMAPYALMKGLGDKIVTEDMLRATRDTNDPQKRLF